MAPEGIILVSGTAVGDAFIVAPTGKRTGCGPTTALTSASGCSASTPRWPGDSIAPVKNASGLAVGDCETAAGALVGFPTQPVWMNAEVTAPPVVIKAATTSAVDCNRTPGLCSLIRVSK